MLLSLTHTPSFPYVTRPFFLYITEIFFLKSSFLYFSIARITLSYISHDRKISSVWRCVAGKR